MELVRESFAKIIDAWEHLASTDLHKTCDLSNSHDSIFAILQHA